MKYSRNAHTEILYRHQRKKKKKRSNIRKRVKKIISVSIVIISVLSIAGISGLLFIRNSPVFNVKNVITFVSNDPDIVAPDMFSHLKGNNIFSVSNASIDSIIRDKSIHYGLQAVIREYPADIKVVLYKRIPIISINREYTVYQDFSMKHIACNANVIDMSIDIGSIESPYDIPGFASIFASLIRQHDRVESIKFRNGIYTIHTDNSISIIMKAGNELPEIDKLPDQYRYVDIRFRNSIYVK